MAIVVDHDTRLVVQGLTGSEGRFHGLRNRAYGTNVVAGVTPGKGGQDVEGIPVFDAVQAAVEATGADTSLVFVPARFAAAAVDEAADAGIGTIVCITEHIPVHDMMRLYAYIAGFSAPPGKTMGHAGAIISGSSGTAQAKKEALEAAGISVGTTPTEVAQLVAASA